MAATAETKMTTTITDTNGGVNIITDDYSWTLGVGNNAVEQLVSLTNAAFTALSVPTGAKAVRIRTGGAASLVMKGVTGDTGIAISPASGMVSDDIYLTLGATPSIGFLNNGAAPVTIRVTFM